MKQAWVGHKAVSESLMQRLQAGRLPHALLLTGPKGIGKATFARHFAATLLSGAKELMLDAESPVRKRMDAGSHADFMLLDAGNDDAEQDKHAEISVDEVRGITSFLSVTASEGAWRVAIVDGAEDMNTNAANALLKTLEEPPKNTLLMLISHSPGRLLPTIRSRCAKIVFQPLNRAEYFSVLMEIAPEIDRDTAERLGAMARWSPGQAFEYFQQEALEAYDLLLATVQRSPVRSEADIAPLVNWLGRKQMHRKWRLLGALWLTLIERTQFRDTVLTEAEAGAVAHLLSLAPASVWADEWFRVKDQFMIAEKLHLDYKTTLTSLLSGLGQSTACA